MMIGSHGDCPVKGITSIGKTTSIGYQQASGEIKLPGVLFSEFKHFRGNVNAMQLKSLPEGQKVRAMGTADIEQPAFLPSLRQRLQFCAKYRPVPEVIPARGYLVEYIYYYLTPCVFPSFKVEEGRIIFKGLKPLQSTFDKKLDVRLAVNWFLLATRLLSFSIGLTPHYYP